MLLPLHNTEAYRTIWVLLFPLKEDTISTNFSQCVSSNFYIHLGPELKLCLSIIMPESNCGGVNINIDAKKNCFEPVLSLI